MALSYYSNWDAFQHEFTSDTTYYLAQDDEEEHETKLLPSALYNDNFPLPPDSCCNVLIDNLFDPDPYYNNLNNIFTSETFQIYPQEPAFHGQKRQKQLIEELIHPDQLVNLTNNELQDFMLPPDVITIPTFPAFSVGSCQMTSTNKAQTSLSPQSIAARQRRRKISEKTQELGKLIPGAQKMNTAEMFGAAYKYIEYLRAQVRVLEFMDSFHQEIKGDAFRREELHGLVESPVIQEKLYATGKCMVPIEFVNELGNDQREGFQLKPHIVKEIKRLNPSV